jgi:hypothetical protein
VVSVKWYHFQRISSPMADPEVRELTAAVTVSAHPNADGGGGIVRAELQIPQPLYIRAVHQRKSKEAKYVFLHMVMQALREKALEAGRAEGWHTLILTKETAGAAAELYLQRRLGYDNSVGQEAVCVEAWFE